MVDDENIESSGTASIGTDGNGEIGVGAAGAEAKAGGKAEKLGWMELIAKVHEAEQAEGQHGRRICRIFFEGKPGAELFNGDYGNAPVEVATAPGFKGYQYSDGEIVKL